MRSVISWRCRRASLRAVRTGFPVPGLLTLVLASALAKHAYAEDSLAKICTADEVKVFACVLKSRQQVGFCLGKTDLKMRLVVRAGESQASSPVTGLREATLGGNAHGDIITLQGDTSSGPVALYVDFITDDVLPPVLVQGTGKQQIKEPCASATFETEHAEIGSGNAKHAVRLSGLREIGVAKSLTPVPEWPD